MKQTGYLFLSILLLSACHKEACRQQIAISGYDNEAQEIFQDSLISDFSCFQLESVDNSALSNVIKLELTSEYIFISDLDRVLAFDKDGKFSHQIGTKGNAESEYISLATFMLDSDRNIVLVDAYNGKLLYFKPDGTFIKAKRVKDALLSNVQDACFLSSDKIFASQYVYNDLNNVYSIIDIDENETKEIAKTPLRSDNTKERVGRHPFVKRENDVHWILPFSPEIYSLEDRPDYYFNTSRKVYTHADLAEIRDFSIMTYFDAIQSGYFAGFTDIFETKDYFVLFLSNLECTWVNKKKHSCRRFSIQTSDELKTLPLNGIISSYGNTLVGVTSPLEFKFLKIAANNDDNLNKLSTLQQSVDINGNPIILLYNLNKD